MATSKFQEKLCQRLSGLAKYPFRNTQLRKIVFSELSAMHVLLRAVQMHI